MVKQPGKAPAHTQLHHSQCTHRTPLAENTNNNQCVGPGASRHLHTGVEGRFTLKVVHDDAVVTIDDVLVDAFPAEMFQYFINAVDAIQNSLEKTQTTCKTLRFRVRTVISSQDDNLKS